MTEERFQEYVDDFRAFSKLHKVGYGRPEDLAGLMVAMRSSDRFRADLASMVRTVLYREREGVTQAEMLRLVAVVWGGDEAKKPGTLQEAAAAEIGGYIREVLSRPAAEPLEQVKEEEEEVSEETVPELAEEPGWEQSSVGAALAMKADEGAGEAAAAPEGAREDPWAEGSALHRELMRFKAWRST